MACVVNVEATAQQSCNHISEILVCNQLAHDVSDQSEDLAPARPQTEVEDASQTTDLQDMDRSRETTSLSREGGGSSVSANAITIPNLESYFGKNNRPFSKLLSQTATRRAIFEAYWERGDTDSQTSSQEGDRRLRSRSQTLTEDPVSEIDIRYFSPPPNRQKGLKEHHSLVEEVPDTLRSLSLPTPLRRYVSDGPTGGGAYPLLSPCSILRKRSDDVRGDNQSVSDEDTIAAQVKNMKWADMTTTVRPEPSTLSRMKRVDLDVARSSEFLGRGVSSSHDAGTQRKVRFDPRIVITEFDDDGERVWFTERELHSFKSETVVLAQKFMLSNPMLAEEFTRSQIDPITGKERRRALFSLPFLSAQPDDPSFTKTAPNIDLEKLAKAEVQRILIVDPNKMILELFCRSIKQLFPHARISIAQSGEDAHRIYESVARHNCADGFDIVVSEEKLYRAESMGGGTIDGARVDRNGATKRFFSTDSLTQKNSGIGKQASLSNLQSTSRSRLNATRTRRGMSGSDLFNKINLLESRRQGSQPAVPQALPVEVAQLPTTTHGAPLLVGVSVDVSRDEKSLRDSGADMVWGKPPPRMGETLRNQMLNTLVTKRQFAQMCVRLGQNHEELDVS